jgi:hypothetical protein
MTYIDTLTRQLDSDIEQGQRQFSQVLRTLVASSGCPLTALLNPHNSVVFRDPLLLAHFTAERPTIPLEQFLFGYIDDSRKPTKIPVLADVQGIVYVPMIGYFSSDRHTARLTLSHDPVTKRYELYDGDKRVHCVFEPPLVTKQESIEVCRYNNPLLELLFIDKDLQPIRVDVATPTRQHIDHLSTALAIIRDYCPDYYAHLVHGIRKIVMFSHQRLNSFASLAAHGAIFLNAAEDEDEIFFLEDLAHQGGHVVFSTATFDQGGLFQGDPNMPVRTLTGDPKETRTLYVVLHGLFTEIAIISCLETYLATELPTPRQRHELEGRLAFIISRFAMDLKNVSYPGVFASRGKLLYHEFVRVFEAAYHKRRALVRQCNFSNQAYTFSYRRFAALNPGHKVNTITSAHARL